MRISSKLVLILGLVGACGGDDGPSPGEACKQVAAVLCERYYACLTDQERQAIGFPATEAGCVQRFEGEFGCESATADNVCEGNEKFHADKAEPCLDGLSNVECSQFRDPNFDYDAELPACVDVCTL